MRAPAIKYTWLRIVLYLIAIIVASAVGMIAGLLVVIPLIGDNIMELLQDIAGLIDRIGPIYYGLINLFSAGALLLTVWLFCRFIDRRNLSDLGFPIGVHFTWNFFQGPVYGFEVSGMSIKGIVRQQLNGSDWLTGGAFGLEGSVITVVVILAVAFLIDRRYRNQPLPKENEYETIV